MKLASLAAFNVAFIRHGNTGPATSDLARALTPKGRLQAAAARVSYVQQLTPIAPLVACSKASRCVDTATIALGGGDRVVGGKGAFRIEVCDSIYDGSMQPGSSASEAFQSLGYAPLRAYHQLDDVRAQLEEYAATCMGEVAAVAEKCAEKLEEGDSQTLLVCGHAVYLPSMALHLAQERGLPQKALDSILDYNTEEASGFLVGSGVELLTL